MQRQTRILVALVAIALWASSALAVGYSQVTVGTSATLIYTAPLAGTGRLRLKNPTGGQVVYLGDAAVLTTTGYQLGIGDVIEIPLSYGDKLYGIVAATTQVVYTLQPANEK